MGKNTYYAVARGRNRGIYRTWAECEAQVSGFSEAKHKSFATEREAMAFLEIYPVTAEAPLTPASVHLVAAPSSSVSAQCKNISVRSQAVPPQKRPRSPVAAAAALEHPIEIYVDGACSNNGQHGASAGFGGWYGDDDPRNFSRPLEWNENQTNNRGELRAIEYALTQELEAAERSGVFLPLHIHTDSKYCLDGIHSYMPRWKSNGFITADRQPVKNEDLWQSIDRLIAEYSRRKEGVDGRALLQPAVQFSYVKGHSESHGNAMADRLAVQGAAMQRLEPVRTRVSHQQVGSSEPVVPPGMDQPLCKICKVAPKSHLVLPCRHALFCKTCAVNFKQDHEKKRGYLCPVCNCKIESMVEYFV